MSGVTSLTTTPVVLNYDQQRRATGNPEKAIPLVQESRSLNRGRRVVVSSYNFTKQLQREQSSALTASLERSTELFSLLFWNRLVIVVVYDVREIMSWLQAKEILIPEP
jgi:hypothetical protein